MFKLIFRQSEFDCLGCILTQINILNTTFYMLLHSSGCVVYVISRGKKCIVGVMISVLALSAVGLGLEPWSAQTKDYQIGICCFSAKHTALRRKNKDWLAWNQDNVSKWGAMSIRGLLFQWPSTIKIQLSVLVQYNADLIIISLKINLFSPWYSWKIAELALNNNHTLSLLL